MMDEEPKYIIKDNELWSWWQK